MVQTKKPNKLVVIAVILIWTIVIGQVVFYGFFNNAEESSLSRPTVAATFIKKEYNTAHTFTLRNDYPDPFKIGKQSRKTTPQINKIASVVKDTIQLPQLVYKGVISDGGNGNKIFALSIDNADYAMRAGEVTNGVKIIKGDEQGISLMVSQKRLELKIIE